MLIFAGFGLLFLGVSISNLKSWRFIENEERAQEIANSLSVLIPVRNEAVNLRLNFDFYVSLSRIATELLIYDDESTDDTAVILNQIAVQAQLVGGRVQLVKSTDKPPTFLGKNWACWNLALASQGQHLLFIDADVRGSSEIIFKVHQLLKTAHVVTIFPRQILNSFQERAVIPLIMDLMIFATLPVALAEKSKIAGMCAANGQFLAWQRETYFRIGGHQIVSHEKVEDMALIRLVQKQKLSYRLLRSRELLAVKMYQSWGDLQSGFGKNLIGLMGGPFLAWITGTIAVGVFGFLLFSKWAWIPLGIRLLQLKSFRRPWTEIFFHPIGMGIWIWLFFLAFTNGLRRQHTWKGRRL